MPRSSLLLLALLLALPATAADANPPSAYDSEGRRDPFQPAGTPARSCLADEGLMSLQSDHVRLRGLIDSGRGPLAALGSSTIRGTVAARVGDRLCDGRVEAIDFEQKTVTLRIARDSPLRPWRERVLVLDAADRR